MHAQGRARPAGRRPKCALETCKKSGPAVWRYSIPTAPHLDAYALEEVVLPKLRPHAAVAVAVEATPEVARRGRAGAAGKEQEPRAHMWASVWQSRACVRRSRRRRPANRRAAARRPVTRHPRPRHLVTSISTSCTMLKIVPQK